MRDDSSMTELNGFLAKHEPVAKPRLYDVGSLMGEWRITAFLGSGGNAEVYRVVRDDGTSGTTGTSRTGCADGRARSPSAPQPQPSECAVDESVGALKILLREDTASRRRFAQEVELLRANRSSSFARFLGAGEVQGRPYLVTELLEPIDLPNTDAAVSDYLLNVCVAVGVLHRAGLIHRDIKPSNIMRRANGELVLIDLGLVKDEVKSSEPERDVSIVSGKVIAVGTPRFAAPEQMIGGRVTAAADIHAIGRLADVAFGSNPPRHWLPIIRRATSSIPEHRYRSVRDLARAIQHRHYPRRLAIAASIAAVVAIGAVFGIGRAASTRPPGPSTMPSAATSSKSPYLAESAKWAALCSNGTTNVIELQLVTDLDNRRVFKKVPRRVEATFVHLNNATNIFREPLVLTHGREYFIEGPGLLTADLRSSEKGATVHLRNCFVVNRSPAPLKSAGIRYIFDRGAYLNFPLADEPDLATFKACFANYDAAFNDIRFGGPETPRGLIRRHHEEQMDQLRRAMQTFFKNFHFLRHIFAPRGKYVVEDMEDSIYKKYGINPNRIPTDAEVELVAYCFDVDNKVVQEILACRKLKTSPKHASVSCGVQVRGNNRRRKWKS